MIFTLGSSVNITFILADGTEKPVKADFGDTLLDIAHDNDLPVEGVPVNVDFSVHVV